MAVKLGDVYYYVFYGRLPRDLWCYLRYGGSPSCPRADFRSLDSDL